MRKVFKNEIGITLVALVVTIIILLILAGISIATLTKNGLFEKAKLAKEKQQYAEELEDEKISKYEEAIEKYVSGIRNDGGTTSTVIEEVSFICQVRTLDITLNVNVKTKNSDTIIGYHAFAINSNDNSKINTKVTENSEMVISNLTKKTKYKVFVVAYDIYNNYKISEIKEIMTLEEPVKLIPELTSNTSAGGTAFATYTANGRSPWDAFDGKVPFTAGGDVPGYMVSSTTNNQIGYDFGEGNSKIVSKIVYYGHPSDYNVIYTKMTLQYSDNGVDWTNVETFNPIIISTYKEAKDIAQEFEVSIPQTAHRYWRIDGTNSGRGWSGLLELEFWGY